MSCAGAIPHSSSESEKTMIPGADANRGSKAFGVARERDDDLSNIAMWLESNKQSGYSQALNRF